MQFVHITTTKPIVMSVYVVIGAGRHVYVILNILLIFLEIVRLLCVLFSYITA